MSKNDMVKFAVGGAVQAKDGTYISRPADTELLTACKSSEFAYVLACRQIGKSSLMNETASRLAREGIRTARIDLNIIGKNVLRADDWYFNFMDILAHHLELDIDIQGWWDTRSRLTVTRRFLQFLQEVILSQITGPVVIFVDEIDMMLGLSFADDFFAAIRAVYNERAQEPAYQRLTFVLLGVAAPDDLIRDETRTPFNIGKAILLPDFTMAECAPFRRTLEAKYPDQGRAYFDQIYAWTQGHPYLTQKLCAALLKSPEAGAMLVENLVHQLFLSPEGRGDDNLQFVQSRIKDDAHAAAMLRMYKRILGAEERVADDEQSIAINRLKLYGLIVAQNGRLAVRNRLYRYVFDLDWADDVLRDLRLGLPGDYTILQRIGQGDLTTIYLAQTQYNNQTQFVALKVVDLQQEAEEEWHKWTDWLRQISPKLTELEHPHLVRVYEADYNIDDKTLFIAMEYIPGKSLQEKLKAGPLPRNEAVEVIKRLGSALSYIHDQNLLHMGINPGNILFDPQVEPARPVLINVGLGKLGPADEYIPVNQTTLRVARHYLAPEQWRQPGSLSTAADVYGLAVTFFEILTGQLPPKRQPGEPLPPLSGIDPELGNLFDDLLVKATAPDPAHRFDKVADFVNAIEVINQQAEQIERVEQQHQAAQAVALARSYIQKNRYDPEKALSMVEVALEMSPGYRDALRLRGKIQLEQDQLDQAIKNYQAAYEQDKTPSSEVGLEYLEALNRVAEILWQRQKLHEAVHYYDLIRQVVNGQGEMLPAINKIWQQAQARLIEYHQRQAEIAYASESPDNIDEAIQILNQQIESLETLNAQSESEALRAKAKRLQIQKYQTIIDETQTAIDKINAGGTHARLEKEDMLFHHYLRLDDAYQNLLKLEPDHQEWQEHRHKKLKEWLEIQHLFAIRAVGKLDPDYEAALRHYKTILDIEQTRWPGIAQELNIDLYQKIPELEQKADHDGKYREILTLMESGELLKALERLDKDFISERNYEHRDVARLLWGLVYAKKYQGRFPPEWENLSGFDFLNKRLVELEKERISHLEARLEPWSQTKILKTIDEGAKQLGNFEEQVKSVETLLDEAIAHGVTEKYEIERCRQDLAEIKQQIQEQRNLFFQMQVNEIAQKVEAWLLKTHDLRELLDKSTSSMKDISTFMSQSDEEQQAIEQDPMFDMLQALTAANGQISRTIDRARLQIKARLVRILFHEINQRDEALAKLKKAEDNARTELNRIRKRSSTNQMEVTTLQKKAELLENHLQKFNRQYEVNRYVIPFALLAAGVTGGVIISRFPNLSQLTAISWIAFILLIVYFCYYCWIYYISEMRNK